MQVVDMLRLFCTRLRGDSAQLLLGKPTDALLQITGK